MATHSSVISWRTPWTEEPGGLQSMGLQRAGHDRATNTHTHQCFKVFLGTWLVKNLSEVNVPLSFEDYL